MFGVGLIMLLTILAVIVVLILVSCIRIVRQAQALVIERLGAYQATWSTGLHFKLPIVDRVARKVDLKEQVVDFAPQPVITTSDPVPALPYYYDAAGISCRGHRPPGYQGKSCGA